MNGVVPPPPKPDPAWTRLIPDTRSTVTLGMFALAWRLLEMIDSEPKLLANAAFVGIATLVMGGSGLGAAISYFYGSSRSADKQTAETVQTLSNVVSSQNPSPAPNGQAKEN